MGCTKVGHRHDWPTNGLLIIQRCEIRCNFCKDPIKAKKDWKYAWFLRRHVRSVHVGKGNGCSKTLEVSDDWLDEAERRVPGSSPKGKKYAAAKRAKREDSPDRPPMTAEEAELFKDEEADDVEDEGLSAQKELPAFGDYAVQPIYDDVEPQFPLDPMDLTGRALAPVDLHYDHSILFANELSDADILNEIKDDIFSDDNINAWLKAAKRGPFHTTDRKSSDESEDVKHDPATIDDLANHFSLPNPRNTSFAAIGITENEDEDLFASPSSSARDSFFMSSFSSDSDDFNFLDDQPLAHAAHSYYQELPRAPDSTATMMNMLSATTDMSGLAIPDQVWCTEQYLHALNIQAAAQNTTAGATDSVIEHYEEEEQEEEQEDGFPVENEDVKEYFDSFDEDQGMV